jgi:deferrochelatase/peroxidase EfeB
VTDPEHRVTLLNRSQRDGEPLIDYVVPSGGAYFFLPPGTRDAQDWVGSGLFA